MNREPPCDPPSEIYILHANCKILCGHCHTLRPIEVIPTYSMVIVCQVSIVPDSIFKFKCQILLFSNTKTREKRVYLKNPFFLKQKDGSNGGR